MHPASGIADAAGNRLTTGLQNGVDDGQSGSNRLADRRSCITSQFESWCGHGTLQRSWTGVDLADFTLTRNAVNVPLTGLIVTKLDDFNYSIDLSTVTALAGSYILTLRNTASGDH